MCDKVIIKNAGMLMFISDFYKDHNMCNKVVNNYSHTLKFTSQCCKIQKRRGNVSYVVCM